MNDAQILNDESIRYGYRKQQKALSAAQAWYNARVQLMRRQIYNPEKNSVPKNVVGNTPGISGGYREQLNLQVYKKLRRLPHPNDDPLAFVSAVQRVGNRSGAARSIYSNGY